MSPDEPDPLRLRTIPTDRSPSPRRATWIVLLVVLVTGSAAAAVAWRIADVAAEDKRSEAVESVLRSIERDTDDLVVAMSGTSALVQADGTITQGALDRYATDLAAVGQARPLVWMTPVAADSWEIRLAAVGRGPDPRPDDDAAALDGLEAGRVLGADSPLAAAANSARELGRPTLARVDSGRGARLVVLKPLYLIGDGEPEFIGVAASADLPGQLPSRVATDVPADVRFRVADGDTVLAVSDPPPTAGVTTDVAVAGRILSVQVEDARPVNHDLSWFLLWIMAVIVAAAGVVWLRSARYDQDRRLTNATISRTAALAQRLARAATVDEVADVIGDHVPALLGGDVASFGEVDGDVVRLHHRSGTDPAVAELTELPLDGIPSLVREVDAGHTVLLRDPQEWRRAMPGGSRTGSSTPGPGSRRCSRSKLRAVGSSRRSGSSGGVRRSSTSGPPPRSTRCASCASRACRVPRSPTASPNAPRRWPTSPSVWPAPTPSSRWRAPHPPARPASSGPGLSTSASPTSTAG